MKFAAILFLAFVAAVTADSPTKISDNNVGDIVTVGVNANLSLSNEQNWNIISVLAAILNQQALIVLPGQGQGQAAAPLPAVEEPQKVDPFDTFAKMFQQN
jgi:hypothetical protein